jgi:FkbM family methyltransferase
MKIGKRKIDKFLKAIISRQHYIALFNIFRICPDYLDFLVRYLLGSGSYPYSVRLKTPLGLISPTLFSYYDTLTVNEIFCRLDYGSNYKAKVVVDFGSNIGLSALYFLTRNNDAKCYLFEPVPENIKKLNDNLQNFKNRYHLSEVAVSTENGIKEFGIEEFGRCGGLSRATGDYIKVSCVEVNQALKNILNQEEYIDILKIDIEGSELEIVHAIDLKLLPRIKVIYLEVDYSVDQSQDFQILSDYYNQSRYGNTIKLTLKSYNNII